MGYGMYGRGRGLGMGRGLGGGFGMGMGGGMGLSPNLSASYRSFPESPGGWWNSSAYSSQMMSSAPDLTGQPNLAMYYPQFPSPMLQQQSFLSQQIPYGSGMGPFGGMGRGMGMGLGGGFGMGYRRRFDQFSGGMY